MVAIHGPARTGGEHTLEGPARAAEPPGRPPRGRVDPQQDAASVQPACVVAGHPHGTIAMRLPDRDLDPANIHVRQRRGGGDLAGARIQAP